MGANQELYTYILSGGAMIVVLFFAMRLSKRIKQDQERKRRLERYVRGPALANNRYRIKKP
jgi:hypothetical protein